MPSQASENLTVFNSAGLDGRSDWRSSPPAEKVRVFIGASPRSQGRPQQNQGRAATCSVQCMAEMVMEWMNSSDRLKAAIFRSRGDHEIWQSPQTGKRFPIDNNIKSRHIANTVLKQPRFPKHFRADLGPPRRDRRTFGNCQPHLGFEMCPMS